MPAPTRQQSRVVPTDGNEDKSSIDGGSSRGFSGTHTEENSKEEQKRLAKSQRLLPFTWADVVAVFRMLTYANLKAFVAWLLSSASIDFSISFDDLLMIMTFYVLFIEDVRILGIDKQYDDTISIVNTVCLFTFIGELVLTSWSKTDVTSFWPLRFKGHFFSFFFWLDVLAIVSMFPDISWIANPLGMGSITGSLSDSNRNIYKAARVARTVRLARLVRVYRITAERRRKQHQEEALFQLVSSGSISFDVFISEHHKLRENRNLKVGAELSETITKRVIIIVLAMLILVPVLSYSEIPRTQSFSFDLLHDYNQFGSNASKQMSLDFFLESYSELDGYPYCLKLLMEPFKSGAVLYKPGMIKDLRDIEISKFRAKGANGAFTEVWFSNHEEARAASQGGVLLTLFIMGVMLIATIIFTSDAERLVLKPIERMMSMVNKVRRDPLQPVHLDRSEGGGEFETVVLEMAIQKITSLLRVCFGEAGAKIISENLSAENQTSINPLIPGSRVYAIFGFCDIHHFEEVNEKLGKEIMTFVNTIAAIVHGEVHAWAGQSNKNLGNAFLVVWRIGEEKQLFQMMDHNAITERTAAASGKASSSKGPAKRKEIDLTRVPGIDALADRALIAYLKIIADINRSTNVLQYRKDKRLTDDGKHDFKVRMGFGLHAGWAIEGAVGSVQKVDATYLSPHVNMAARLETSSRQYGVPVLLSERVYELMSPPAKSKCRQLDIVTVKGSEVPIGIYTYDCLQDQKFAVRTRQRRDRHSFVLKRNRGGAPSRYSVSQPQTSRLKSTPDNDSSEDSYSKRSKTGLGLGLGVGVGKGAVGEKQQAVEVAKRVLESDSGKHSDVDKNKNNNSQESGQGQEAAHGAGKKPSNAPSASDSAPVSPRDTGASLATAATNSAGDNAVASATTASAVVPVATAEAGGAAEVVQDGSSTTSEGNSNSNKTHEHHDGEKYSGEKREGTSQDTTGATRQPASIAALGGSEGSTGSIASYAKNNNNSISSGAISSSGVLTPVKAPPRLAPLAMTKGQSSATLIQDATALLLSTSVVATGTSGHPTAPSSTNAAAKKEDAETDGRSHTSSSSAGNSGPTSEDPAPPVASPAVTRPAPTAQPSAAAAPVNPPSTTVVGAPSSVIGTRSRTSSLDAVSPNNVRPSPSANISTLPPSTSFVGPSSAKYMRAESVVEDRFFTSGDDTSDVFEKDADLLALRRHITPHFLETFKSAVDLYIAGDWVAARPLFESANMMMMDSMGGDGPCKTLLKYMAANNYDPQSIGWKGYRPLTSK